MIRTHAAVPRAARRLRFTVAAIVLAGGSLLAASGSAMPALASTPAPIVITTTSPLTATAGAAYLAKLDATGGIKPYSWSLAGGTSLPAGLVLHASTGEITGKPAGPAGTSEFTVEVTDSESSQASATALESITVTVTPLTVTTVALPAATAGVPYSATLAATVGVAPYSWSIPVGSLPAGLKLRVATGVISGTPTGGGNFTFTAQVTDSEADAQVNFASEGITVGVSGLVVTTGSTLPTATSGVPYSVKLAAAGGVTPYQWSVATGALPAGLKLAKASGVISGTTTATGPDSFTVHVTDSEAPAVSATESVSLYVVTPMVLPGDLPGALVDEQYDTFLQAAGGLGPYSYAVTVGSLPPGLALQPDGEITGSATAEGTSSFTVSVTDAENPPATATHAESITVAGGPIVFNPALLQSETINLASAQELIASGGVPPFNVTTTSGALPPGQNIDQTGTLSGTPTQDGTYQFTVQVTDSSSSPQTATQAFTVSVTTPIQLVTTSLPDATAGQPYSATLTATGGAGAPYTFSLEASALPDGLSLDPNTGIISGTPTSTTAGDQLDFQIIDANGNIGFGTLNLAVVAPNSSETFGVGSHPAAIAFDGANMWVANSGSDNVTELSPAGATLGTFSVGMNPDGIAFDGTNMWVVNFGDNTVTELSPAGATLGTFGVGNGPVAIAFDGTNMWVVNYNSSNVTELSPAGATLGTFSVGMNPDGIAFDGTNMWVVNFFSLTVTELSPAGATLRTFLVGSEPVAIAFDGTNIWVAYGANSVKESSPAGGAPLGTFSVGENPDAIAFDGTNMWVANSGDNTVTELSPAGATLGTFSVGENPDAIAFDGTNMWVANSESSNVTELPTR